MRKEQKKKLQPSKQKPKCVLKVLTSNATIVNFTVLTLVFNIEKDFLEKGIGKEQ